MMATLRKSWLKGLLLTLCTLTILSCAWIGVIQSSSLTERGAESLLLPNISTLPALSNKQWTERPREGRGSIDREWTSGSEILLQEVWVMSSPIRAKYHFHAASRAINYRREFRQDLVRSYSPPSGLKANDVSIFCGNIGKSTTDSVEDCQIWGYWARYGQYVFYLEIFDSHEQREQFMEASKQFDAFISDILLTK
jgi:hypothetical protein